MERQPLRLTGVPRFTGFVVVVVLGCRGGGRGHGDDDAVLAAPVLTSVTRDAEFATACQRDEIFPRKGFLATCLAEQGGGYSWPPMSR